MTSRTGRILRVSDARTTWKTMEASDARKAARHTHGSGVRTPIATAPAVAA